ncbi:MAG: PD-(D/E)XK nuclease family protein, partial [bacterium]|nr:PD-(D/E)XK nuclease family protein [bacterium]
LDALTLGTLYHRCMELLDFDHRQASDKLIARVVAEMDLDTTVNQNQLAGELDEMISKFTGSDLLESIAGASGVYRELDFVLTTGQLTLRGQIDLLYRDDRGNWHVVDYKSDKVAGDSEISQRAGNYELQMLAYSIAAGGHFNQPVTDATLYFLRPGRQHTFGIDPAALQTARDNMARLTENLITARRTGQFERVESARCSYCPYSKLCNQLT